MKTHAASVQNSLMFYIYQLTKVHVIPNTDCVQSFVSRNISVKLDGVTCTCIERNFVFIGKETALFVFLSSFLHTGHGSDVKCVDWHPQKSLLASGSKDNQQPIKLWDPKAGTSLATM